MQIVQNISCKGIIGTKLRYYYIFAKADSLLNHMNVIDFTEKLRKRLEGTLPGPLAHARMAPVHRPVRHFLIEDHPTAQLASVMVLFFQKEEAWHITLIRRPAYDGVHGGQIAFPGGRKEQSDNSPLEAALRETEEEIGVPAAQILTLGKLSDVFIPPSNFFVYPFVGFLQGIPVYKPDPKEVFAVIELPLQKLMDDNAKSTMQIERSEGVFTVPCYTVEDVSIWGATAIILSELEMLMRDILS